MSSGSLPRLPVRPADGHKGTFGHVLCVAGSVSYPGAAVLCVRAALRSGAGLATLAYPVSARALIGPQLLCEMGIALPDDDGAFGALALDRTLELAAARQAVGLGPGLTTSREAAAFAREVALLVACPLVLDADGLNAFAGCCERLAAAAGPRVLTPHPGEAARLLGCSTREVTEDRDRAALDLANRTGSVVLLKGAPTLIAASGALHENTTGNAGMATGGSGDVLTGLIAGLLAQGVAAADAARLGAHLHGAAGDLAAARLGQHGMTAADILAELPVAIRTHEQT